MSEKKVVRRGVAILLGVPCLILLGGLMYVIAQTDNFANIVNSQQPQIAELFRKLNPDVLINWLPGMHPLRNVLFGSALIIGICWIIIAAVYLQMTNRFE